jgi:hypothetical protein
MADDDKKIGSYPIIDPHSGAYHVARTAIDAAVSVVPGAGYAVGQIVEAFISAPLQKRRDEWFERVGLGLQLLQDQVGNFDVSRLNENDDFVSVVAEATTAAIKTTRQEKLEALRNGVLNIANGFEIDEVVRGAFIGYILRFSPAHLHALSLLSDPSQSPEMVAAANGMSMGAQWHTFRAAMPEEMIREDALQRVLDDLNREGLAETNGMKAMGTSGVFLAKRSTGIGDAFLRFIASPFPKV